MELSDITFPDDTRYAYAVGRIRALEKRLLTRADFSRLLDAESYSAALRMLAELGYPVSEGSVEYEPVLVAEQRLALDLLDRLSEDRSLVELFQRRYDFHNLKVLLKAKHSKQELEEAILDLGTLPVEKLAQAVMGDEPGRLPAPLAEAMTAAEEAYAASAAPGDLDVAVERRQYAYMAGVLEAMDNSFLRAWLTQEVDLLNIKSFLRIKWLHEDVKKFDDIMLPGGGLTGDFFRQIREEPLDGLTGAFHRTPYGKAVGDGISHLKARKSFAPLERSCDDLIVALLRTSAQASFGVEPVVAYILLKEFEIRGVRAVLVGKLNGLPKDKIKERLLGAYV